jgi:hypothetical protein
VVSSPFGLRAGPPEVRGEGMFTPCARMHFAYLLSACLSPSSPVGRACPCAGGVGRVAGGVVDVRDGVPVPSGVVVALPGEVEVRPGVVEVGVEVPPAVRPALLSAPAGAVDVSADSPHAAKQRQASSTAGAATVALKTGLDLSLM